MKIAVAGGMGTVGRYVVEAANRAGHDVTILSRSTGVDLLTGVGLDTALDDVEVIIDTINTPRTSPAKATAFFTATTRHLQTAGAARSVDRLITLSIVGLERVPGYGYYQAKLKQEAAARSGPLPVSIVRATQFHEFPAQILARTQVGPFAVVPRMKIQPIAARTVGEIWWMWRPAQQDRRTLRSPDPSLQTSSTSPAPSSVTRARRWLSFHCASPEPPGSP